MLYTYSTLSAGQRLAVGSVQSVQLIMYAAIKTNIYISRDHIGKSGKRREVNRECLPPYISFSELSELMFLNQS